MKPATTYTNKQVPMQMLQAFALFQKDGVKAVEQTYPEYLQFVLDHKANTYREVRQELFEVPQES